MVALLPGASSRRLRAHRPLRRSHLDEMVWPWIDSARVSAGSLTDAIWMKCPRSQELRAESVVYKMHCLIGRIPVSSCFRITSSNITAP